VRESLARAREEISALKVKAGGWGALSGAVAALAILLLGVMKNYLLKG